MNKIYFEECLHGMSKLPSKSIDLVLCDLPYGSTKCSWDVVIPFEPLWEQYERLIKPNKAIILFGTGLFFQKLILSNEKMFKYDLVWKKSKSGSAFTAKYRPLAKHENIAVFGKGKVTYNPQLEAGKPYYRKRKANKGDKPNNHKLGVVSESETVNTGFRYPGTILDFPQKWRRQDQLHPTQKPVELFEYLISSYSNEGDIVLDNCMGSGTTAIACINTGRNYVGFENDPKIFSDCQKRIENHIMG